MNKTGLGGRAGLVENRAPAGFSLLQLTRISPAPNRNPQLSGKNKNSPKIQFCMEKFTNNSFLHGKIHQKFTFALKNSPKIHFCIKKFTFASKNSPKIHFYIKNSFLHQKIHFCIKKFTKISLLHQKNHFSTKKFTKNSFLQ